MRADKCQERMLKAVWKFHTTLVNAGFTQNETFVRILRCMGKISSRFMPAKKSSAGLESEGQGRQYILIRKKGFFQQHSIIIFEIRIPTWNFLKVCTLAAQTCLSRWLNIHGVQKFFPGQLVCWSITVSHRRSLTRGLLYFFMHLIMYILCKWKMCHFSSISYEHHIIEIWIYNLPLFKVKLPFDPICLSSVRWPFGRSVKIS